MRKSNQSLPQVHGGVLKNLMVKDSKRIEEILQKLPNTPRLNLSTRQLCDLELLMNGGFSPLEGFMDKDDYESVVKNMRLKNGTLWPIPIVLDVSDIKNYKIGSELILCDQYGKPLSLFTISSIYKPSKKTEAKFVYGTTDQTHFGVNQLMEYTGNFYLGGRVEGINNIDHYDFTEIRLTPEQIHKLRVADKSDKLIGFQTRNPLHKAHYTMIKKAAEKYKAKVLIHPSVGMTKIDDVDYITRTKSYKLLHKNYSNNFSYLSLLPLAMRMAGPREALWHAIIRKNYGCTHFIVGRDHAGPGSAKDGTPFYGIYEAQELVKKYSKELNIIPIFINEMVYVEELNEYLQADQVKESHTIKKISGTRFREMIQNDEHIPEWFSFPEIISEVKRGVIRQKKDGLTLFFTGLPSAGKSTIALNLYYLLLEVQNKNITILDGDVVRNNLSKGLGFSKEDRDTNIARIGFVANEITKHRGIAICSAIAPFEQARQQNRKLISSNGNYIEVYISTPAEVCKQRDVKGLYKMASVGKLKGLTGFDDSYEVPSNPEITIDTENRTPKECVDDIVKYLIDRDLIHLNI